MLRTGSARRTGVSAGKSGYTFELKQEWAQERCKSESEGGIKSATRETSNAVHKCGGSRVMQHSVLAASAVPKRQNVACGSAMRADAEAETIAAAARWRATALHVQEARAKSRARPLAIFPPGRESVGSARRNTERQAAASADGAGSRRAVQRQAGSCA